MKKAIINKVRSGKSKGQFRFTLWAANGQVIATCGTERYQNLQDCIDTVEHNFPDFEVSLAFVKGQHLPS